LSRRHPAQRRINHPIPQILAVCSCHARPRLSNQQRTRIICVIWESPQNRKITNPL
jgi:hypothetical protein